MELAKEQLERQDFVDNECNELILKLGRTCTPWNIELIAIVRDAVQEVIVDKLHRMTEMEFYPYIELKETDEAQKIREYLAEGGSKCLYCGSKDIEGGNTEMDGDSGTCQITCNDCGKEWYDCYTLTGVLPI